MKKILIILLFSGLAMPMSYAQNKQTKVLLEQIAALQVYIGYAQKGYSIVKKGLNTIGDFKRGEFNLHTDYFNSLRTVNPAVAGYSRVAEILLLQGRILEHCDATRSYLDGHDYIHSDELDYLERVFARLLEDCDGLLEQLEAVTTDNQLEMKDNERLKRIDTLYEEMMDAYTFCEQFTGEAKALAQSRMHEDYDTETARTLHGQ
jgi:hypothetical protein